MNTLIIDNYDSYTFNLYQQASCFTKNITVLRNSTPPDIIKQLITLFKFIIISRIFINLKQSAGPGNPTADFGICNLVIELALEYSIPLLGVCLGHQGIANYFNNPIIHASEPMHGRLSFFCILLYTFV